MIYRIQVKNHVDLSWSHWFEAMQVTHLDDGVSVLFGPVRDSDHLYRILEKIRDLNLGLLSVDLVEDDWNQPEASIKPEIK